MVFILWKFSKYSLTHSFLSKEVTEIRFMDPHAPYIFTLLGMTKYFRINEKWREKERKCSGKRM